MLLRVTTMMIAMVIAMVMVMVMVFVNPRPSKVTVFQTARVTLPPRRA
jgi:hypothetical protein